MRTLLLLLCIASVPAIGQAPQSPLKKFVGTFDVATKLFMGPGQTMQIKATATFREDVGGRFVRQDYKDAQTGVTGVGYFGYDPRTKQYSSVWMYNMSPQMEYSHGALDNKGMLRLKGKGREYTHTWTDADTRVLRAWDVRGGQRRQLYEITYTRRK